MCPFTSGKKSVVKKVIKSEIKKESLPDISMNIMINGEVKSWEVINPRVKEILAGINIEKLPERIELLLSVGDMVVGYASLQTSEETIHKYFGTIEQNLSQRTKDFEELGKKIEEIITDQVPAGIKEKIEAELRGHVAKLEAFQSQLPDLIRAQLTEHTTELSENIAHVKGCTDTLGGLISRFKAPTTRGEIGQDFVFNTLLDHFKEIEFTDVSKSGQYTDIAASANDMMDVLVEIKNYSNPVPKKEVTKFWRDLENREIPVGCFLSLGTRISYFGDFKIVQQSNHVGIFINVGFYSGQNGFTDGVNLGFFIAQQFAKYLKRADMERVREGTLRQKMTAIYSEIDSLRQKLDKLQEIQSKAENAISTLHEINSLAWNLHREALSNIENILQLNPVATA